MLLDLWPVFSPADTPVIYATSAGGQHYREWRNQQELAKALDEEALLALLLS